MFKKFLECAKHAKMQKMQKIKKWPPFKNLEISRKVIYEKKNFLKKFLGKLFV